MQCTFHSNHTGCVAYSDAVAVWPWRLGLKFPVYGRSTRNPGLSFLRLVLRGCTGRAAADLWYSCSDQWSFRKRMNTETVVRVKLLPGTLANPAFAVYKVPWKGANRIP